MGKKGTCPLCGERRTLTKEHVYTQWSRNVIKRILPSKEANLPPNPWKYVCDPCNSGMNEAFEEPGRPVMERLIAAEASLLSPRDQFLAARWMLKTNLVVRLTADPDLRAIAGATSEVDDVLRDALQRMLSSRGDMPILSLRAGNFAPFETGDEVAPFAPVPSRLDTARHKQVTHLGFVIWELVMPFVPAEFDLADLELPVLDERLVQIWPPTHPLIVWPPTRPVDLAGAQALRDSWSHPPEGFRGRTWPTDPDAFRELYGSNPFTP